MRRVLMALAGVGIVTLAAVPPLDYASAPGPTASFGDRHLTVTRVARAPLAGAPHPVPADGTFYVLTVRTIGPGPFEVRVVDALGRAWTRAYDVEEMLPGAGRRFVFDVDDGAVDPVLEVRRPGSRRVVEIPLPPAGGP